MNVHRIYWAIFILISVALLLAGCGGGGGGGGDANTASVTISTAFSGSSTASLRSAALSGGSSNALANTAGDVTAINVTVVLASDGTSVGTGTVNIITHIGTITGLPVGTSLNFSATANNSFAAVIFTGSTTGVVLTGVGDAVTIQMAAAAVSFDIPKILAIRVPSSVLEATTQTISADVETSAGEASATFEFTPDAGGGVFVTDGFPGSTDVLTTPFQITVTDEYTAPAITGALQTFPGNRLTVANTSATVISQFPITVVETPGADVTVTAIFNPVLFAIQVLQVSGTPGTLVFTGAVSDDAATATITYAWAITGAASFSEDDVSGTVTQDSTTATLGTATGTMTGYDQTSTGNVTLTLTDADLGVTAATFVLPVGLFPDDIVLPLFDFETGSTQGWTVGGLWHVSDLDGRDPDNIAFTSTRSLRFGDSSGTTIDNGVAGIKTGNADSPSISTGSAAFLNFDVLHANGCSVAPCSLSDNRLFVEASIDGTNFVAVAELIGNVAWRQEAIDLSPINAGALLNAIVTIRLRFDSVSDTIGSPFAGSVVDNVVIKRQ